MGDSKTHEEPWVATLAEQLNAEANGTWIAYDRGSSGASVASARSSIAQVLSTLPFVASAPDLPQASVEVLCNWGANDVYLNAQRAQFVADYLAIIDATRARYTAARFRLTKPWRRGYAAQCDELAGWIDDVVAARPGVAFVGDDERVWLENGDNGVGRTTDGIHYNAAGNAEKAAQMLTVLGY